MSDLITHVSDEAFEAEVLQSETPVLLDFWAEWCGPCKQIAPALEAISKELEGKLTIAKINLDENPNTPAKYGVRSIPTLILFKNGEAVAQRVGALPQSMLAQWVNSAL